MILVSSREARYIDKNDLIKMRSLMLNIPVKVNDVIRAQDIYGPDVASFKGKTVKRKHLQESEIEVPRSIKKRQNLYTDIFYWEGVGFMLTISIPLRKRFITVITKSETKTYLKSLIEGHISRMKDHSFDVQSVLVEPQ